MIDLKLSPEQRAALLDRLGWRLNEWSYLTGTSRPTIWRQARAGKLRIAYIDKIPTVPRSEAIRLGLIEK
jgi:hypothetical protein